MAQYFIGNSHNTIKFFNASGFSLESYENIEAFIQVLDLISKAFFAPTIGFFYITTVIVDQVFKFSNNCFKCFLFNRFNDVHDFVCFHEITSSFGLWLPFLWEQKKYISIYTSLLIIPRVICKSKY